MTFHTSAAQPRHLLEHGVGRGRDQLAHHRCRRRGTRPGRRTRPRRGSWVTITIVWPCSVTALRRNASTSAEALESRLPVGSSAKINSGRAEQRPRARRCAAAGHRTARSADATGGRRSRARRRDSQTSRGRPAPWRGRAGRVMLSRGAQRRDEVERLEHEADPVAAQVGQAGIVEQPDLVVADERATRRSGRPAPPCSASASTCPTPTVPSRR